MIQVKYLDKNMCTVKETFNSEMEVSMFISGKRNSIAQIISIEKIIKKDFM